MPSISRRGTAYLLRYYRLDGVQVSRSYATRAGAQRASREIGEAHDRGVEWIPPELRAGADLGAAARDWLDARAVALAPRTLIRYAESIDLLIRLLAERHGAGP